MRIRIGLLTDASPWRQMLSQEGVSFGVVDIKNLNTNEWSVVVVTRSLSSDESAIIDHYLHHGGGILGFTAHLSALKGIEYRREWVDHIVSDAGDFSADIGILDLGVQGFIPREANRLRTDAGAQAVFAGPFHGGHAVILPFDPAESIVDPRSAVRRFYFSQERLPSDRVSLVNKGEMRHLVRRSLEYLHFVRGLPYVHLSYFPDGKRNLFAFRVDTDGAPKEDIDDLYRRARDHEISVTWFLDVKSHEDWIAHFHNFVHHEIGVHCYLHQTFETGEKNKENISTAISVMKAAGFSPKGFAAPFGMWNRSLSGVLEDLGFAYSSEFSYAYDTLPFYPEISGVRGATLQVPIHPVCIGSMLRVGYSEEQMSQYFRGVMERKMSRGEPLFFYHHPSHRSWGVMEDLFEQARRFGITSTTLLDFAEWWKRRERIFFHAEYEGNVVTTGSTEDGGSFPSDVWIEITTNGDRSYRAPLREGKIDLRHTEGSEIIEKFSPPDDIRRAREFDSRSALGDLYNMLMRKFQ